jgi:hypothetical protein
VRLRHLPLYKFSKPKTLSLSLSPVSVDILKPQSPFKKKKETDNLLSKRRELKWSWLVLLCRLHAL